MEHIRVVSEFFTEGVSLFVFELLNEGAQRLLGLGPFIPVVDLFVKFIDVGNYGGVVFHLIELIRVFEDVVQVRILLLDDGFVFNDDLMVSDFLVWEFEDSVVVVLLFVNVVFC